ncbi:TPA: ribonuclease HI family protein [Candidatus Micrarchaeota archaeon]|nr:ribonuclease HI family protein [Candidatus Micrarchaeota archaeon]
MFVDFMLIYTDGACSGNPGKMGIGAVLIKNGVAVKKISESIGDGTNNIAEYTAVIRALEEVQKLGEMDITLRSDSELLVKQLRGEYRIRAIHLRDLKRKIDEICKGKGHELHVIFEHVPREQNKTADKLSKDAIGL